MTEKKRRTTIPDDVAAQVLFEQGHTCCVCREKGLKVQIHHIDDDPSNHDIPNLAVLCFEHHEQTQTRGGFGRKRKSEEIIKYRDDWVARVAVRRNKAGEIASTESVAFAKNDISREDWSPPREETIVAYLWSLPEIRRSARRAAKPLWEKGSTLSMNEASYTVAETMEQILVNLASFYPPGHFGDCPAHEYFSEYIQSRYDWYHAAYEPNGPATGGTMVSNIVSASVMRDAADAVETLVNGIDYGWVLMTKDFDIIQWRKDWKAADEDDKV